MKGLTLCEQCKTLVNTFPLGDEFLSRDIAEQLGVHTRQVCYALKEMLANGEVRARQDTTLARKRYFYRRLKVVSLENNVGSGRYKTKPNLYNDFTEPYYRFCFGGNNGL